MTEQQPDPESNPKSQRHPCDQEWECGGQPCKPLNGCDPLDNSYLAVWDGYRFIPHPDPATRFCNSGCVVPTRAITWKDLPPKLAEEIAEPRVDDCAWLECDCRGIEDAPADGPSAP